MEHIQSQSSCYCRFVFLFLVTNVLFLFIFLRFFFLSYTLYVHLLCVFKNLVKMLVTFLNNQRVF